MKQIPLLTSLDLKIMELLKQPSPTIACAEIKIRKSKGVNKNSKGIRKRIDFLLETGVLNYNTQKGVFLDKDYYGLVFLLRRIQDLEMEKKIKALGEE